MAGCDRSASRAAPSALSSPRTLLSNMSTARRTTSSSSSVSLPSFFAQATNVRIAMASLLGWNLRAIVNRASVMHTEGR
jgi:hypothetical protein